MLWLILNQLKSKSPKTREGAIIKLGNFKSFRLAPHFIEFLKDPDPGVRKACAVELGKLRSNKYLNPLLVALKDSNPGVREAAVDGLVNIGDPACRENLLECLRDENITVRWHAAKGLETLKFSPANMNQQALLLGALGHFDKLSVHGAVAVEAFGIAMKGAQAHRRQQIVESLGRIRTPEAVAILTQSLKDEIPQVRMAAVEALGTTAQPEILDLLIVMLADKAAPVRSVTADVLGKISHPAVIEPLSAASNDPDWEVRMAVVTALARIPDPEIVPPLINALSDGESEVRQVAAKGLGKAGDLRAIEPLMLALKDPEGNVRQMSLKALGMIDPDWNLTPDAQRAIPALIPALNEKDYWVRQSAADALLKTCDSSTKGDLINALKEGAHHRGQLTSLIAGTQESHNFEKYAEALASGDATLRKHTVWALARIGDLRAMELLAGSLKDPDVWVRKAALQALESLNWHPRKSEEHALRAMILQNWAELLKLGPSSFEALSIAAQDSNSGIQWHAVETLGKLGNSRAIPLLVPLLDSPHAYVKKAATDSLQLLGWKG